MCGLSGVHHPGGDPACWRPCVTAMADALGHRGPDDQGEYGDPDVSLGFRRLAVIDLETGQQPVRLEGDRAVLVFNGEIYNFRELRRELATRQRFRSRGDAEVVLRLYAEEGPAAFRRLNGMFALALWDRLKRTLYLVRDRHGIKPLFVHRQGQITAFASELSALLAGGFPERRALDRRQLRHYLFQKYASPDGAMLEGVRQLPPATILELGPAGERQHRYWSPPAAPPRPVSAAEAAERLRELLPAAVERQLVADVPVGVFLSGGLDSSTLAALVCAAGARPVRTFTIGFEGPDAVSELTAARSVARALHTEHHELVIDPAEVARRLDAVLERLDGSLGDATAIPTWFMSQLARRTVTVALAGEGADELFGGYGRQRYDAWLDVGGAVGRWLAPAALRVIGRGPSARLRRRLRMSPGLGRQLDWGRVFTADQIAALTLTPLPAEEDVLALHDDFAARWRARAAQDPLGARLEADRELFLPGDLLPKVDRMSMAHSLEVRVPYLDDELVDFLAPLPGRLKVRLFRDKVLLRDFARPLLPPAAGRPKQGFLAPISAWLRGPLRPALTDLLASETLRRRSLFRPEAVSALVDAHLAGTADHGEPLWLLMALEGWMQRVLDRGAGARS